MDELLVAGDHFLHLGLDGDEVFRSEGGGAIEVVEEAGVGGGAVAELGLREELQDGGGEDVGGGVADDFERFRVRLLDEFEAGIGGEGGREVDQARGGCVFSGVHCGFSLAVGRWRLRAVPLMGVRRATTAAAARRGEMELAMSKGVVPEGTSRTAPSGRCTAMVLAFMAGRIPMGPRL